MEAAIILIIIMFSCVLILGMLESEQEKTIREFNEKKYRYESVSMDTKRAFSDSLDCTLGKISKHEYKRRNKRGYYTIYAWVEVGKSFTTWMDDPINKEIFLRYAHDTEKLPEYLQTDILKTVKDYRSFMNQKNH